ncbi:MAG TPA: glycosyltransferase, partial [Candidatus Limnocylindrales bacterium]|nr:glycosyltransferase [Candidatus Limnocylindrales bacterium]
MRQLGLEVAVVSFADGPLARSLERAGIPVEVLGLRSRADPRGASRLWRLLRSRRPDVLHSHGPGAMVIANPLGRLAGVPAVVTTFHHMAGGGRAVTNQPLHAIYYRLEGLVGRIATDACVAYAEATREDAIRVRGVPAERVVAIHNGIDLARFGPLAPAARGAARAEWRARLGIGADALVVGAIGRLLPAKGHEHLVRALPAIRAERPEAVLVVVGDGPLAGRLREIGDRLGLGDALVLPGALRASPDLYACFDVFVYPS